MKWSMEKKSTKGTKNNNVVAKLMANDFGSCAAKRERERERERERKKGCVREGDDENAKVQKVLSVARRCHSECA